LLQRTASLALKFGETEVIPPATWSDASGLLKEHAERMLVAYETAMNDRNFSGALAELWQYIGAVNAYFHEQQPWKVGKEDLAAFKEIIAAASQSMYLIAHLIEPVMPYKSKQLLAALGHTVLASKETIWRNEWQTRCTLFVPKEPLFIRPEVTKETDVCAAEKTEPKKVVEPQKKEAPEQPEGTITIHDLIKVELVVGQITACEPMPKSDKLLRMQVEMGEYGQRQILAGIGKFYSPEQLINKKAIFVANLPPRKMMGTESQGMMLFAKDDENQSLVTVDAAIAAGTRLS
jgi:methionyl-tRNA synthetase